MTEGNVIPIASAPAETRTIIDPTSGDPITVVIVPEGAQGVAFMVDGDAYPRVQINVGGADNGVRSGDGTAAPGAATVTVNPLQPAPVTSGIGIDQSVIGGDTSDAQSGGAVAITGGAGPAAGGIVRVFGGAPTLLGGGGQVIVHGGNGAGHLGPGGYTQINGGQGSADDGEGGDVTIFGGEGRGAGEDGIVQIGGFTAADYTITIDGDGNLGMFGTTPAAAQSVAIPDAAGGAVVDAEARTALNALLAYVRALGYVAT